MVGRVITIIIVLALLLVVISGPLSGLYTEFLWFESLGYLSAFWVGFLSRVVLGGIAGLGFFVFLALNLFLVRRSLGDFFSTGKVVDITGGLPAKRLGLIFLGTSLAFGLLGGLGASTRWLEAQEFINAASFQIKDPIFGNDIGFYVFRLPFLKYLYSTGMFLLVVTVLMCGAVYVISKGLQLAKWRISLKPQARYHLSILVALGFFLKAWGYRLNSYDLLYSPAGVVFGAGYTDVFGRLIAYRVALFVALGVGLLFLLNCFFRMERLAIWGTAGLIAVSFLMGSIYPALLQRFVVEPNEIEKERPFIEDHITFTRKAYGLEGMEERRLEVKNAPTLEDILSARDTLENIRLWDWRPLRQTYAQLQEIRLYYDFRDVDLDRYLVGGKPRQVALSARELSLDEVAREARTWVNDHLKYTHGYGLCMSPVNEVNSEGLPRFFVRDIPPESIPEIPIKRPEIYFGEETNHHVIVRTRSPEFDYPLGDKNAYATYQGTGGVPLSSFWRKVAFSVRFGNLKILLSGDITAESRVLFRRNIRDRVRRIAPFLRYDGDPYLVVADGKLFWMWDAYTTTARYPYSRPHREGFNYIRNPVKVVVDAYEGSVKFYLIDEEEPIALVYSQIYEGLFAPYSEMPASLREHIRYPEEMFRAQAEMLAVYHMTDPVVFYNKEDYWALPKEIYAGREERLDPYYTLMRPPGETELRYIIMIPFTPTGKDNMIAWLFASCDAPDYGRMVLYKFPKQRLIYGPMQIESRIDQDPGISQLLTLWNQRGSSVVRGNLIVIPLENSLLYVEPLYILGERSELPELKRIIVATPTSVAMDVSFETALAKAIGRAPGEFHLGPAGKASEAPSPLETGPSVQAIPERAAGIAKEALEYYREANERLKKGDWAGYGEMISKLGDALRRLNTELGR